MDRPHVLVIAGPNGAGKSTTAPSLLRGVLGVAEFVNADVIAQGLSAYNPGSVAIQAGRLMLERLKRLARERKTFAFETTLASRSFAPWFRSLQVEGYEVDVMFFWLPTPEQAIARVRFRVSRGGHDIPPDVVRRRYRMGVRNFLELYSPLAGRWWVYDNSLAGSPDLVAERVAGSQRVAMPSKWIAFKDSSHD